MNNKFTCATWCVAALMFSNFLCTSQGSSSGSSFSSSSSSSSSGLSFAASSIVAMVQSFKSLILGSTPSYSSSSSSSSSSSGFTTTKEPDLKTLHEIITATFSISTSAFTFHGIPCIQPARCWGAANYASLKEASIRVTPETLLVSVALTPNHPKSDPLRTYGWFSELDWIFPSAFPYKLLAGKTTGDHIDIYVKGQTVRLIVGTPMEVGDEEWVSGRIPFETLLQSLKTHFDKQTEDPTQAQKEREEFQQKRLEHRARQFRKKPESIPTLRTKFDERAYQLMLQEKEKEKAEAEAEALRGATEKRKNAEHFQTLALENLKTFYAEGYEKDPGSRPQTLEAFNRLSKPRKAALDSLGARPQS